MELHQREDLLDIACRQVRLIGTQILDVKVILCGPEQLRQDWAIIRIPVVDRSSSDDVRFHRRKRDETLTQSRPER